MTRCLHYFPTQRDELSVVASSLRFWTFRVTGHDKEVQHGVPDRDAVNITLSATNVKQQESGIFCCKATYQDLNDRNTDVSSCQKIRGKLYLKLCHMNYYNIHKLFNDITRSISSCQKIKG